MDFLERVMEEAMPVVTSLMKRGGAQAPYRVFSSAKAVLDAGGKLGLTEAAAIMRALNAASRSEQLSEDQRDTLRGAFQEMVNEVSDSGFSGYPTKSGVTWGETVPGSIEASATPLRASDESEGLQWEVRLIKSGRTVDGRQFYTKEAIRNSVDLFQKTQCFIDHAEPGTVPSATKLVGWFTDPKVVETEDGQVAVDATLHVLETSTMAPVMKEAYQRGGVDAFGFSIMGNGKTKLDRSQGETRRVVETITDISSVDLVTKPNAGGRMLRLRAAVYEAADSVVDIEEPVQDPVQDTEKDGSGDVVQEAMSELGKLREEITRERTQRKIERLVERYDLPQAVMQTVEGRVARASSVDEAEEILMEAQTIWATALDQSLQDSTPVLRQTSGPRRSTLRLQGLIANQNIEGVKPFGSLREAFSEITGNDVYRLSAAQYANTFLHASQGFNSQTLQETVETTDWSYALGQALHRELIRQYNLPQFDDWRNVVSNVSNLSDMRTNDRLRHGYYDTLSTVNEGGTYQDLTDPTEERAYFSPSKYGGLASFTWEDALNDDLNVLRSIPKKLALSAKVTLWYTIMNLFAATTPPTCSYDSVAWFHNSHSNLGSTDLSAANYLTARKAIMTATVLGNSTISLGLPPKYMLVPPDLEGTARQLRDSDVDIDVSAGENIANPWKGEFEIIVIPFWSDSNAWVVMADPQMAPTIDVGFLGGKEEPDLFTEAANSGSNFTADKITYKIRHVWGYCILDHRGVYKSNGSS